MKLFLNPDLAEKVRIRRAKLRITQAQAAEQIGVGWQTLLNIERHGKVTEKTQRKIRKWLKR